MTPKKKDVVEEQFRPVGTEETAGLASPNESVQKGVAAADPDEPVVEQAAEGEGPNPPLPEPGAGGTQADRPETANPPAAVALYSHTCGVVATGPKKRCPGCGQVQQLGDAMQWKRFDVLLAA